jgi:phosphoserine phosphatase
VTLAIFDLDNTLIGGDSDHLWGQFVCEQGLVNGEDFSRRNEAFYADYEAGTLDIIAYLRFSLGTLKGHPTRPLAPGFYGQQDQTHHAPRSRGAHCRSPAARP